MDAKTIVAVVLVAFIIGGFLFLQKKNRKINNLKRGRSNPPFAVEQGGQNEPVREDRRQSSFCA